MSDPPLDDPAVGPSPVVDSVHGHPLLAAQRRAAEDYAYGQFHKYGECQGVPVCVVDVGASGGSMGRLARRRLGARVQHVHALSPLVTPADYARATAIPRRNVTNVGTRYIRYHLALGLTVGTTGCTHTLNVCDCLSTPSFGDGPRVVLACHSAYYLTAADWGHLDDDTFVMAIAHRFVGPRGDIAGEFDWERDGHDIVMTPRAPCGNTYRHRDITPEFDAGWSPAGDRRVVYWMEERRFVDTYVYRGVVATNSMPLPPIRPYTAPTVPPVAPAAPPLVSPDPLAAARSLARSTAYRIPVDGSAESVETAMVSATAALVRTMPTLDPSVARELILRATDDVRQTHRAIVGYTLADRAHREARTELMHSRWHPSPLAKWCGFATVASFIAWFMVRAIHARVRHNGARGVLIDLATVLLTNVLGTMGLAGAVGFVWGYARALVDSGRRLVRDRMRRRNLVQATLETQTVRESGVGGSRL